MTWTAENVPAALLKIVSNAAGKAHKPGGDVAGNLADVLNAYDKMRTVGADPHCTVCKGSGIEPGSGDDHGLPYGIDPNSYEPCECVLLAQGWEKAT